MKTALITGASSGIGLECAKILLSNNYKVIGVARDFAKTDFTHQNFYQVEFDLLQVNKIEEFFKKFDDISVLIHSAGVGYFAMHEDIKTKNIINMSTLNFTVPMVLTKIFSKSIKKNRGFVFFIASASALEPSPFGANYSATKSALIQFNKSYFKEIRKSGAKSVVIMPDITKTDFFNKLSFAPSSNQLSYIMPQDVANMVLYIINQPANVVVTEVTIKPQIHQLKK